MHWFDDIRLDLSGGTTRTHTIVKNLPHHRGVTKYSTDHGQGYLVSGGEKTSDGKFSETG
jgi:hypothetical protein